MLCTTLCTRCYVPGVMYRGYVPGLCPGVMYQRTQLVPTVCCSEDASICVIIIAIRILVARAFSGQVLGALADGAKVQLIFHNNLLIS